uniref:Uncharacterized protein n=1 Tax=Cacopsylla melanoneura TaxID=428564 RepID=A0A8D8QQ37_9HEMI
MFEENLKHEHGTNCSGRIVKQSVNSNRTSSHPNTPSKSNSTSIRLNLSDSLGTLPSTVVDNSKHNLTTKSTIRTDACCQTEEAWTHLKRGLVDQIIEKENEIENLKKHIATLEEHYSISNSEMLAHVDLHLPGIKSPLVKKYLDLNAPLPQNITLQQIMAPITKIAPLTLYRLYLQ